MLIFRFIFVSAFIALFVYLTQQLTRFAELGTFSTALVLIYVGVIVAAPAAMPLFFWSEKGRKFITQYPAFLNLSYYSLPLFSSLLSFVVLRDVCAFLISYYNEYLVASLYSGDMTFLFIGLSFLLLIYGAWKVQRGPVVKHTEVIDRRIPTSFAGTRILQISDLHISHFVSMNYLVKVLRKVQEVQPDLIVLTGDIVDGDLNELESAISQLKALHAPMGVYFCPGNHEYYWSSGRIMKALEEQGVKVLVNTVERIKKEDGELLVAGIPDPQGVRFGVDEIRWESLVGEFVANQFRVLLSHQPNQAKAASSHGFHLQFSGHTHGGQFFPWSLLSPLIHRFNKGYYFWKGLHIYVNEGTAYWGPAVRNFTTSEISVITLIAKR